MPATQEHQPETREGAGDNFKRTGFHLTEDGLFFAEKSDEDEGPKEWLRISAPIRVVALTTDETGSWGKLVTFPNPDGTEVEKVIPLRLFERGADLREVLRDSGFDIASSKHAKELLVSYLQSRNTPMRARVVKKLGWYGSMFVLPDCVIGGNGDKIICDLDSHDYGTAGTLEDWQREIAAVSLGNSRLVLAISTAFSGPLLSMSLEAEPGGFHYRAGTSTGKTTALEVANSAWGGPKLLATWRTTANGLEATAQKHNCGLLCLDELGQIAPRDAGDAAYLLANGRGKGRMTKDVKLRDSMAWQLIFLSSGEISLAAHMQEAGKKARGGQLVRVVDVPADAGLGMGLFETLHRFKQPQELAEHLKAASKRYFGTPIRAFLRYLVANKPDVSKLISEAHAGLLKGRIGLNGEICRVAKRFALVAAAGELATRAGVTGWPEGTATAGVRACFDAWLTERGLKPSDASAAVAQVRLFLEQHDSRFVTGDDMGNTATHDRAGFKRTVSNTEVEYCVLPEVFKQVVCAGFDPKMVARALKDQDYLVPDNKHLTVWRTLPGPEKQKARVYAVRCAILTGDTEL